MMDLRRIKELEDVLIKVEYDKINLIRVKQSYFFLYLIIILGVYKYLFNIKVIINIINVVIYVIMICLMLQDKVELYEEFQKMFKFFKFQYRFLLGKAEELRVYLDKVCVELVDVKEKNGKVEEINDRFR